MKYFDLIVKDSVWQINIDGRTTLKGLLDSINIFYWSTHKLRTFYYDKNNVYHPRVLADRNVRAIKIRYIIDEVPVVESFSNTEELVSCLKKLLSQQNYETLKRDLLLSELSSLITSLNENDLQYLIYTIKNVMRRS